MLHGSPAGLLPDPGSGDAGAPHRITGVAVSPGGRYVVGGASDGTVLVWDAFEPERWAGRP